MCDNAPKTIPSELLCETFQLLCSKPISLHVLDNSSCSGEFPWAVGQVCKRWRLSYPHLWTSLYLRHHSTDIVGVDRLHEMTRRTLLYLERSKQLRLTVTVRSCYTASIEYFPRTTWKLILSCSERWERADLVLYHEPAILDLLRCKVPIVKSLRLRAVLLYAPYFRLYNPFTSLTELDLLGSFGALAFTWSQLTKVKISLSDDQFIGIKMLETFLSRLQNVEELRVGQVDVWHMDDDRDQRSIRLASLRLLAVPIYPLEVLTRIEAPLLEHLWVDWCPTYHERGYSHIFAEELSFFIRRSSCHIRRLTLHNHVCHLLPRLVGLLWSIEELCIETTFVGRGSFLVKHITQMTSGIYLPNLRKVEVSCRRGRLDDEKLMAAMSRLLVTRSEESRLMSVTREELGPTRVRISMSFK